MSNIIQPREARAVHRVHGVDHALVPTFDPNATVRSTATSSSSPWRTPSAPAGGVPKSIRISSTSSST